MKAATLLIFLASLAFSISQLEGFSEGKACENYYNNGKNRETQAYSKDFCRSLGLSGEGNRCCFLKYEVQETDGKKTYYKCAELTWNQFAKIEQAKSDIKDKLGADIKIKSLECESSSYLYGSLLLLLVLLF